MKILIKKFIEVMKDWGNRNCFNLNCKDCPFSRENNNTDLLCNDFIKSILPKSKSKVCEKCGQEIK